jgi:hypothetical protein
MDRNRTVTSVVTLLAAFTLATSSAVAGCSGTSTNITCTSTGTISLTPTGTGTTAGPTSTPDPVLVTVSGLTGTLATITVQLTGLTHNDPEDLAFQLVAPDGTANLVFMSDTDGYGQVTSTTLAFSDAASGSLPSGGSGSTGTFKPTSSITDAPGNDSNYNFTVTPNYSAPLGSHTLNGIFAGLTGTNLNGTWKIYINDTFGPSNSGDSGSLSSISLTMTTTASAVGTTTSVNANPAQVFTSTPGNSTTLTATVTASGTPVTTGTVTFTDNGTTLTGSPVALNGSGQAALVYTATSVEGSHVINATYSGSTGDLGSSGQTSLEVDNHPTISGSQVCNGPITLGPAVGEASSPYGSRLYVPSSSYSGTVSAVTLSLNGVTTPDESSFALLLAAPGGSHFFIPMDEIGFNSGTNFALNGFNLVLNDSASSLMPSGAQLSSGTFLPSAYLPNGTLTVFPAPAPTATTSNYAGTTGNATFATSFGGVDPVGMSPNNYWDLFVTNTTGSTGRINQWCLSFVTSSAAASTTAVSSSKNPAFVGDNITFTATVTSGGSPVTQGTVTFREGSSTLQGPTTLDGNGKVTFTTTSLAEGMHTIEALYSGATGVANVSTGTLTQEIDNHTVISNGGLTFCNPGTISLPNLSTSSTPYPSRIFVSGLPGTLKTVSVAINGFTRPDPSATAVLLTGPQLQGNSVPENLVVFSEAGDNNGTGGPFAVSNVNLLFQDGGATLPQFAQIASGTYATSFYNTFGGSIVFPAPAPVSYNTSGGLASEFGASDPNGTWQLFPDSVKNGFGNGTFGSWCLNFTENAPSLMVTKTSGGNFAQGSTTGQFTISVANNGPGSTGGSTPVTVTDSMPAGVTVTAVTANNWTCPASLPAASISCSRSDALAAGSFYADSIVLTVSIAANAAPGNTTNTASVNGGGSANNVSGSATVNILAASSLSVTKTHTGNFVQGDASDQFTITVMNGAAAGATSGTVTLTDSLPSSYTAVSWVTPAGWTCTITPLQCTTNGGVSLAAGASASFTLNVGVSATAPPGVNVVANKNSVTVSGGGVLAAGTGSDTPTVLATTTTTLGAISNLSFSASSQSLPVSATVSAPNYPGNTTPTTGTVTFTVKNSSNTTVATLSGVSLVSGVASGNVTIPANQAAGSYTVVATYTGGGNYNGSTSSPGTFTINPPGPVLSISKSHTGNFTQGQTATWSLQVANAAGAGSAATSGTTTVVDTLPAGYTLSTFGGTGWSCGGSTTVTCMTSQAVTAGSSFSVLSLTVNVPATSPVSVTNNAVAYGGGDTVHTNSSNGVTTSDTAAVVQVPSSISVNGGSGQTATVNTAFATALSVLVKDAGGAVINGATITFAAPGSGASGTFTSTGTATSTAVTNASGIATASAFTANGTSGTYMVSASAGSASTNFSLTNAAALINVTQSVSVTSSGLVYNRVSKLYTANLTITNISGAAIAGPIQLGLSNLAPGITVVNATTTNNGIPFITVPSGLAPGQSVVVPVQFSDPGSVAINSQPVVYSGAF